MLEQFKSQIIGGLVTAAIIALAVLVWEKGTDGGLISALGGATKTEVGAVAQAVSGLRDELLGRRLACTAHPEEEHGKWVACASPKFELARWCSGDCSGDDARVTICCSYERK